VSISPELPPENDVVDGQGTLPIELPVEESLPTLPDAHQFGVTLLGLAAINRLGTRGLRALVGRYGDRLGEVWAFDSAELRAILTKSGVTSAASIADQFDTERGYLLDHGQAELRRLEAANVSLLSPSEMPTKLRTLPDAPRWLFVQGDTSALEANPQIAVVGTRRPTIEGVRAAEAVARTMAAYPITLVSGLAEGIDAAAHAASLRDGVPNVAFLGHGIDIVFPAGTEWIRNHIVASGGAVVSEYLPAEHYRKQNFVQRNRLQAGLADVVVAVEGQRSGGTAHTVRFAQKYERQLIGLRWPGAGDLVELVQDAPGSIICDFSTRGRQRLDQIFRSLAEAYGHPTTSLSLVERHLARELEQRSVVDRDLEHLRDLIEKLLANGSGA
jgi:DNA protecting protein DprA